MKAAVVRAFGERLVIDGRSDHMAGRTRGIHGTRPLSAVKESIEDLLHSGIRARIVFDFAEGW